MLIGRKDVVKEPIIQMPYNQVTPATARHVWAVWPTCGLRESFDADTIALSRSDLEPLDSMRRNDELKERTLKAEEEW